MSGFNFDVITLFPKAFEFINNLGVISRALDKNLIDVNLHDLREYAEGSYRQVAVSYTHLTLPTRTVV